jgi:hypothetical protein
VYPMDFAVARSLRVRPGRGRLCAGLPAPDSGRARVSGPRTDSTEGLPRFGTARRASPPPSVNVRARLLPRTQHAERFSVHPDNRLTCVTRANRETCGRAGGEVGRPVPSSGWLCAGLPTPHKFDRRSPAIRYCARSLTRPSVNLRARLLPRTQHANAFQVTPTTDSPASRGRTGRPAVMPTARSGDLRRAAVMPGCARVSRPRTNSTEGLPRFGTAREASPGPL